MKCNKEVLISYGGLNRPTLIEFEVLCRSYDYLHDAQKLKLFPATLKDSALKWFMSLRVHSITTWGQMKEAFLGKYRDYYMLVTLNMKSSK